MFWTAAGDEASWTTWAKNMAQASPSHLLENILSDSHKANARALDLACGVGRNFEPLTQCGFQVIGIDATLAAVQHCHERVVTARIPASPVCAVAQLLPIRNASINLVLAIGILFHLTRSELTSALSEIRRILEPEGEAILHFLGIDDWRRNLGTPVSPESLCPPSYKSVVTCFRSASAIRELIRVSGLELKSLDLRTKSDEKGEQRDWLVRCHSGRENLYATQEYSG